MPAGTARAARAGMNVFPRSTVTIKAELRDVGVPAAPNCARCGNADRVHLIDSSEVYPTRRELHGKPIWKCDECLGYVGCHPGSFNPLGTPATFELRRARMRLHERIDPVWKKAHLCGAYSQHTINDPRAVKDIKRTARTRVYEFIAAKMSLPPEKAHVGMFDIEQCREAWRVLSGISYREIREWAHSKRNAA